MKRFTDIRNKRQIVRRYEQISIPQNNYAIEDGYDYEYNEVSKFFSKLFESREMAHIYHLQVRGDMGSNAEHMALGKYYDEIVDLIDETIEVYQGQYGIIEGYDIIDSSRTKTIKSLDYFIELAEYVKHGRKCISQEDTHIHSLIDDIANLIYKTTYKLKFNK